MTTSSKENEPDSNPPEAFQIKVTGVSKKFVAGIVLAVSLSTGGVISVPQWFTRAPTAAQPPASNNEASHKALQEQIDDLNKKLNRRFDDLNSDLGDLKDMLDRVKVCRPK